MTSGCIKDGLDSRKIGRGETNLGDIVLLNWAMPDSCPSCAMFKNKKNSASVVGFSLCPEIMIIVEDVGFEPLPPRSLARYTNLGSWSPRPWSSWCCWWHSWRPAPGPPSGSPPPIVKDQRVRDREGCKTASVKIRKKRNCNKII